MKNALELVAVLVLVAGSSQIAMGQTPKNLAPECYASLSSRPQLAQLGSKLILSGQPKATLEMQADTSKPDADEKVALSLWSTMGNECFDLGVKWMDAVDSPRWLRSVIMQAKDSNDAITAALYRGELTFGEFNVKRMAQSADMRRRIDEGMDVARREGSSGPIAAVPPPATRSTQQQDLYQCEQDAARSYPQAMVQRMTSPGFQAVPRPAQTNCTSMGNQISCSTAPTGAGASIYNRPPTYVSEDANLSDRMPLFARA